MSMLLADCAETSVWSKPIKKFQKEFSSPIDNDQIVGYSIPGGGALEIESLDLTWPHTSGTYLSSQVSPAEDSGISSETPSPVVSHRGIASAPIRLSKRHVALSDSDTDSSLSTDSFNDARKFALTTSAVANGLQRRSVRPRSHYVNLPDGFLRELRDKWTALERRRLRQQVQVDHQEAKRVYHRQRLLQIQVHSYSRNTFSSSSSSSSLCLLSEDSEEDGSTRSSSTSPEWRRNQSFFETTSTDDEEPVAESGFAGLRDIFSAPHEFPIRSCKGTVRGVRNRVRAGIATFTSSQQNLKKYIAKERGKIVLFVTTLGVVRKTFERCQRVRQILWTLSVRFEERDVFMAKEYQLQLQDRLQSRQLTLPHVFLDGQYLGDEEKLELMNENGELRKLLFPFKCLSSAAPCNKCGGFRLLPCPLCNGSKKSVQRRSSSTLESVSLKCTHCNESGLVNCTHCIT